MLEAEVVEALADGHGGDGGAGADADFSLFGIGRGLLEDDFVALALDDGGDGVAERGEGLAGEAAGAGLGAGEGALVYKEHAPAGSCEVVSGGAACGAGADDEDVVVVGHCCKFIPRNRNWRRMPFMRIERKMPVRRLFGV